MLEPVTSSRLLGSLILLTALLAAAAGGICFAWPAPWSQL